MPFAVWLKRGAAFIATKEFVELLNRIPRWRRINQTPERIDALERRVSRLEAQIELLARGVEPNKDNRPQAQRSSDDR